VPSAEASTHPLRHEHFHFLQAIPLAGLAIGVNRFDKHREQPQTIPSDHIGEQPVAHKSHLGGRNVEFGQHPPQSAATGLASRGREIQAQGLGYGANALTGGVVAEQMDRQVLLGFL
jgi:hypothetical protein